MAVVHPIMFTVRRIVYAISIVFIATLPLLGVWLMLFGTLAMLAYTLLEWQWKDKVINMQHIFNETMTYIVCVFLLLFTNFVGTLTRLALGYYLMGFFACFLVFNSVIMLWYLLRNIIFWLRRCSTKSRRQKIKMEASLVLDRIKSWLTKQQPQKDWFVPDDIGGDFIWDAVIVYTKTGGAKVEIREVIDPEKAALYEQDELEKIRHEHLLKKLRSNQTSQLSSISELESHSGDPESESSASIHSIRVPPTGKDDKLVTILEQSDSE